MKTLTVQDTVGDSLLGTARIGDRFQNVEVGRMAPLLRKREDPPGVVRAGFLDPTIPVELNLLHWEKIRTRLQRLQTKSKAQEGWLDPRDLLRSHPAVGYVPPEVFSRPNEETSDRLPETGNVGSQIAELRDQHAEGKFWTQIAEHGLYVPWLEEIVGIADVLSLDLLAPPVPVVSGDLKTSPRAQAEANEAAMVAMDEIVAPNPLGPNMTLKSFGRRRRAGALYSLHVDPTALRKPDLIQEAKTRFSKAVHDDDNRFWGVHIHFVDMRLATRGGRVSQAKNLVQDVSKTAQEAEIFTWVSDAGPAGPVFLDLGASFTTYHPGMTPGRVYSTGGPGRADLKYGKVLGLWDFNLYGRPDVESKGWALSETGLFRSEVPRPLRGDGSFKDYRVEFGKPYNVSVAQRVNNERMTELSDNGNAKPGHAHVGQSTHDLIAPWAGKP